MVLYQIYPHNDEDAVDAKRRAKHGFSAEAFMTENDGAETSAGPAGTRLKTAIDVDDES